MKKLIRVSMFIFAFSAVVILYSKAVSASSLVKFDMDNVTRGYVTVTYSGTFKDKIYAQVKIGEVTMQYQFINNLPQNLPLHGDDGSYSIKIVQAPDTGPLKLLDKKEFDAKITDKHTKYVVSNPIVNFTDKMDTIIGYKKILDTINAAEDKLKALYKDVTANYTYDYDLASNPPKGYVPVIDNMYSRKKGICFDYSSMSGSVLRFYQIPTRLVMGYIPDLKEYHAWIQVYLNDKWQYVDMTVDAAYVQAKQADKVTMYKDGKDYKIMKIY